MTPDVPEAAVEAAAEALDDYAWDGHIFVLEGTSGMPTPTRIHIRADIAEAIATAALTAAYPLLEAEIRARLAGEIDAVMGLKVAHYANGMAHAARIVRGGDTE